MINDENVTGGEVSRSEVREEGGSGHSHSRHSEHGHHSHHHSGDHSSHHSTHHSSHHSGEHSGHHSSHHSGHHSHHGHHSHSSDSEKRRKKKNKKKNKFLSFLKRNKQYLIYAASLIIVAGCLIFMAAHLDNESPDSLGGDSSGIRVTADLNISIPLFSEDVVIVGPAVEAYMSAESTVNAADIYKIYSTFTSRLDVGLPVKLSCRITGAPDGRQERRIS